MISLRNGDSQSISGEYAQGGNRTKKTKIISLFPLNKIEDRYHYDVEDPAAYGSDNNRLMFYETWRIRTEAGQSQSSSGGTTLELGGGGGTMQAAGPGGGQIVETLLSTTYYFYNDQGNVMRVVTEKENVLPWEARFEATRMVYARNGQAVTYGLAETWKDFTGGQFINHVVSSIHEYRYDLARQRYLKRELDPNDPLEQGESLWTDYDGNKPYGDFTVSGGAATDVRSVELGLANVSPWTGAGGAYTQYYHTDMIGTTRHMTNSSGNETGTAAYTAFGERVSGTSHYYGYAGAWGYETESFPFLHVGHRYYDPAIGRFLQRDPIGIRGGMSVYEYVRSTPTILIDPDGLIPWWIPCLVGLKVVKEIIAPAIDDWADDNYKDRMREINNPAPPPPAPPVECSGGSCDEVNDPPVAPHG